MMKSLWRGGITSTAAFKGVDLVEWGVIGARGNVAEEVTAMAAATTKAALTGVNLVGWIVTNVRVIAAGPTKVLREFKCHVNVLSIV